MRRGRNAIFQSKMVLIPDHVFDVVSDSGHQIDNRAVLVNVLYLGFQEACNEQRFAVTVYVQSKCNKCCVEESICFSFRAIFAHYL